MVGLISTWKVSVHRRRYVWHRKHSVWSPPSFSARADLVHHASISYWRNCTSPQPRNPCVCRDHELYTFFNIKNSLSQLQTLGALTACVADVHSWMAVNKLQLNHEKNEFMTICAPQCRKYNSTDCFTVGATEVATVPGARNPDVIIDQALNMDHHIQRLFHAAVAWLQEHCRREALSHKRGGWDTGACLRNDMTGLL